MKLAADPKVVAIGETGLDHYRTDESGREAQVVSFREHISIAREYGRALVIHDRDAHSEVLAVLESEDLPDRVVFHCFSGDAAMARQCAEAGGTSRSPARSRSRTPTRCGVRSRTCRSTGSSSRPTPPS